MYTVFIMWYSGVVCGYKLIVWIQDMALSLYYSCMKKTSSWPKIKNKHGWFQQGKFL